MYHFLGKLRKIMFKSTPLRVVYSPFRMKILSGFSSAEKGISIRYKPLYHRLFFLISNSVFSRRNNKSLFHHCCWEWGGWSVLFFQQFGT